MTTRNATSSGSADRQHAVWYVLPDGAQADIAAALTTLEGAPLPDPEGSVPESTSQVMPVGGERTN